MASKLKQGDVYEGPMAVFDDASVGHLKAFYALTEDGKSLLKVGGKPVRLTHIDLAPGDATDGTQEFRVAGKNDPPQQLAGNVVELEPENIQTAADVDPTGGN